MISAISSFRSLGGTAATTLTQTAPTAATPGVASSDFSDVFAKVSTEAIDTLKTGESAAISGIQGRSSVQHVVQAIMSAEQTLQTTIAVRDKVVAAYQEISRMGI